MSLLLSFSKQFIDLQSELDALYVVLTWQLKEEKWNISRLGNLKTRGRIGHNSQREVIHLTQLQFYG